METPPEKGDYSLIERASLDQHTITILLVEDTEDDVFFFDRAWRKSGSLGLLHVLPNGQEALRYLGRQGKYANAALFPWPDIVFLDLKMPMVNGFEVLKWVQTQHFLKSFPIVVLSGSAHDGDIQMAKELGAADYLVKPIHTEELKHRLSELMASSVSN